MAFTLLKHSLLAGIAAGLLPAQDPLPLAIGATVRGHLYWSVDRSVRPILGYPGSATIGETALSGIDFASFSPDGRWAVVVKDGHTRILDRLQDVLAVDLLPSPDRVVWSGGGEAVALYSSARTSVQRILLNDSTPRLEPEAILPSIGSIEMLVLARDGKRLAVGTSQGIYLVTPGQQPIQLSPATDATSGVFAPNGDSLYILGNSQPQHLYRFHGESLTAEETVSIAQQDGQTPDVTAVALTANGQYLLVADRALQAIQVFETSGMSLRARVDLEFPPALLRPLPGGVSFLVAPAGTTGKTSIILAKDTPMLYFLPPPSSN